MLYWMGGWTVWGRLPNEAILGWTVYSYRTTMGDKAIELSLIGAQGHKGQ